jgi:Helicase subunit of the DNA excision repair complex
MENTYQDLITDLQGKNPKISGKLEGGKKFKIKTDFKPAGDQPEAIKKLVKGANRKCIQPSFTGCNRKRKNLHYGKSY